MTCMQVYLYCSFPDPPKISWPKTTDKEVPDMEGANFVTIFPSFPKSNNPVLQVNLPPTVHC